jgi:hypothetical protein
MTMLEPGDVRIEGRIMDHARGAWAGMRPQWWTATHTPSGYSVTWHEHGGASQWKAREAALACLDLMVDALRPFPLRLTAQRREPT